ncbi:HDOD domain-containing protein [Bacillus spongiae]|uniref:HDOD domain-containing protein n=1 Tax=Bacillus spongiae TaxID=2683610 RepID=A0ABU8HHT9_9BACI
MEVYVARQPIMDRDEKCVAYELLYRNRHIDVYHHENGDKATADVLVNSFINMGIDTVTNGKPCFINFTEEMLHFDFASIFSPDKMFIEILEEITPSQKLIDTVIKLRKQGYRVALDDFVLDVQNPLSVELLKNANIVKVDFHDTTKKQRQLIERLANAFNTLLLAEKIETREQYLEAKKAGYHYYQGYFFSKPVLIKSNDIPVNFYSYIQVIQQLSTKEPDISKIAKYIEQDLSLSHKLLKLINSPAFKTTKTIKSIQQGIVLIGLNELQKWISILAVREQWGGSNYLSEELLRMCLTRGKLCESIGKKLLGNEGSSSCFLLGMFSLMDTVLQTPMKKILEDLPLDEEIKDALNGKDNLLHHILQAVKSCESGEWDYVESFISTYTVSSQFVFTSFKEACVWTESVLKHELVNRTKSSQSSYVN